MNQRAIAAHALIMASTPYTVGITGPRQHAARSSMFNLIRDLLVIKKNWPGYPGNAIGHWLVHEPILSTIEWDNYWSTAYCRVNPGFISLIYSLHDALVARCSTNAAQFCFALLIKLKARPASSQGYTYSHDRPSNDAHITDPQKAESRYFSTYWDPWQLLLKLENWAAGRQIGTVSTTG
jgi:hypothetical protein